MALRVVGPQPINGATTVVSAADLSSAGTKATYTCPAGRSAVVRYVTCTQLVAGGTLVLKATIGGVTVALNVAAATFALAVSIALNAGDTVTLVASATGAGATNDLLIAAEEYLAA
jgi:hypothetical protein